MKQKYIGITMGCPVGIGPEIIIKFLQTGHASDCRPIVLGDLKVLARCASEIGSKIDIVAWQPGADWQEGAINVMPISMLPADLNWGQPTLATGQAMAHYIEEAVTQLINGNLVAMVTCPITKKALNEAGYNYPGHTEMLAALTKTDDYVMMMAGDKLKVTLVTIHTALADVAGLITQAAVKRLIQQTDQALRQDFGIDKPRIAVAGLNPHAGEQGMFGGQEADVIAPVIAEMNDAGIFVSGPYPPDTVFNRAVHGEFDAVVCMYHDQGLIPFKLIHFADGVNVTLGLPIVRTSVDHGTAYDIAGQGLADATSLAAAYQMAAAIAANRGKCILHQN